MLKLVILTVELVYVYLLNLVILTIKVGYGYVLKPVIFIIKEGYVYLFIASAVVRSLKVKVWNKNPKESKQLSRFISVADSEYAEI